MSATLSRGAGESGRRSDLRQTLAALGTTGIDDRATPAGLHANQEAVRTGPTGLRGLVSALHGAWTAIEPDFMRPPLELGQGGQ